MKPEPLTLEEAKKAIFSSSPGIPPTWEITVALEVLTKVCEDTAKVTIPDMLRCLDYPGIIAESGARFLYVRTGRENLGWRHAGANGLRYSTDKQDWITYLNAQGLI